jgi:hypothetical protein
MAMIMTRSAATTGTTRFKLATMRRTASSAVSCGIPFDGAIVPETTMDFFVCFVDFFGNNFKIEREIEI